MAAISPLPTLGVNATPFEPSGSRLPASGRGRNRRGRGNGRPQDSTQENGPHVPQQGQGEYLATARPPPRQNNRRQPRLKPEEANPRNSAHGPTVNEDHQRGGVASHADGAVGGVVHAAENGTSQAPSRNRNRNRSKKPSTPAEGQAASASHENATPDNARPPRGNARQQPRGQAKPPVTGRRAAFGGKLSSYAPPNHDGDAENQLEEAQDRAMLGFSSLDRRQVFGMSKEADDLTSRLIRGLSTRPYLECPICFADLQPSQAIWSCLPTYSTVSPSAGDGGCCYTPFHLSCMQDWSSRSLKEAREKARDRPAGDATPVTWRCPGCQKHRETPVSGYTCFCGRIKHLKATLENRGSGSLAVPHSCAQSCSRKRSYCGHPCPLPCHPGPCPPCVVSLVIPCASHGHSMTVKCSSVHGANGQAPTCDEVCGRVQDCGCAEHRCLMPCHEGPCEACRVKEDVRCFCGKEEKSVKCGWKRGDEVECGEGERRWQARFGCGRECGRLFDCGEHECHEVRRRFLLGSFVADISSAMPPTSDRCSALSPDAGIRHILSVHANGSGRLYHPASPKMHRPHSDVRETLPAPQIRMRPRLRPPLPRRRLPSLRSGRYCGLPMRRKQDPHEVLRKTRDGRIRRDGPLRSRLPRAPELRPPRMQQDLLSARVQG